MGRGASRPVPLGELGILESVIKRTPMLSIEEERALALRARDGDPLASDRLVNAHMRLVMSIASRFAKSGLSFGDLVSEGSVGLVEAVRRFDVDKGFRLSTYATWWIRAYVQNFVLTNWSLVKMGTSADQKRLFFGLRKIRAKLQMMGVPEGEQNQRVAELLGIPLRDVRSMDVRMGGDTSLNVRIGEDGDQELQDMLVDGASDIEDALVIHDEEGKRRALLRASLDILSDREREIVVARHMLDHAKTLEDLAQDYGVTRERIRQIESKALDKVAKRVRRLARERRMPVSGESSLVL